MNKRRQTLTCLSLIPMLPALARAAAQDGSRIHQVRGSLTINGEAVTPQQRIRPGDRLATGSDSQAIVIVGSDVHLLRENTQVNFAAETARQGMRILTGKLLSVFGKGEKQLHTPTATIGIRGTGCYIEATPEMVYFCLCYGGAQVQPLSDPEQAQDIYTQHHDHPLEILARGRQLIHPSRMRDHTDAELILLESLVGREPPFKGIPGLEY